MTVLSFPFCSFQAHSPQNPCSGQSPDILWHCHVGNKQNRWDLVLLDILKNQKKAILLFYSGSNLCFHLSSFKRYSEEKKYCLNQPLLWSGKRNQHFFFVWSFRPIREIYTHFETSVLPMRDCKFCPMLGTYGH